MIRRIFAAVAVALLLGACGGGSTKAPERPPIHTSCDDEPPVSTTVGETAVCDPNAPPLGYDPFVTPKDWAPPSQWPVPPPPK